MIFLDKIVIESLKTMVDGRSRINIEWIRLNNIDEKEYFGFADNDLCLVTYNSQHDMKVMEKCFQV